MFNNINLILNPDSSSGIGEEIAIHFASLNACVVVTGNEAERVEAVADKCRLLSKHIILDVIVDLQNYNDVKNLVQKAVDTYGKIDILINNAGAFSYGSDINLMMNFDRIINTNVRSIILLVSLTVPYLKITKGCIINISSVAAIKPVSH